MRLAGALIAVAVVIGACGGAQKRVAPKSDFACKGRHVEYIENGGMMYAERGIRLTCAGDTPLLTRYHTTSRGAQASKDSRIAGDAWTKAWKEFDAAGWRFLEDCDSAGVDEREPVYTFEISDGDRTATFRCKGRQLPFPYAALRNALDFAAADVPEE